MIKFNKYHVTNGEIKARVKYNHSVLINGKECVTLYAKDWDRSLGKIFKEYQNDTDSQSDYFEQGLVRIYKDSPYFEIAKKRAASN